MVVVAGGLKTTRDVHFGQIANLSKCVRGVVWGEREREGSMVRGATLLPSPSSQTPLPLRLHKQTPYRFAYFFRLAVDLSGQLTGWCAH